MICRLTFKTPDVLDQIFYDGDFSEDDMEAIRNKAAKFIECGEYIVVELDTKKGTCVVVEV